MESTHTMTENDALAYASSNDVLLDVFYKIVRDVPKETAHSLWEAAMQHNMYKTLQLALFTRDCRGGKGEKLQTYYFLKLLKDRYPRTFNANLTKFIEVGCFKDLCVLEELELMAAQIKADIESDTVSLAAKYAPSEGKKYHHLVKSLADLLGCKSLKEYRQKIVSLRKRIGIVETKLCEKDYISIVYEHVPSRAHLLYKKAFDKHDSVRYKEFLSQVTAGKAVIKSRHVNPHEIVAKCLSDDPITETEIEMWKAISNTCRECVRDTIAVVDVSGSMDGLPKNVAIALGLLIAENTERHQLITFSNQPSLVTIQPDLSIYEKVKEIDKMDWDMNTNIVKVFELLLTLENIPKRLVILSDMQFDSANPQHNQATTHEIVKQMFKDKDKPLPALIYWNLRTSSTGSVPVLTNTENTILVSGYSQDLFNIFLTPNAEFNSESIMNNAIKKYTPVIIEDELNI